MYDTSDIRKGLKVLMDGNPWTVVEFQFVKPGKGAAFTRTKFKNLLNGTTKEMNIRSGEKLEPANVDQREMQFLYKEGGDLVLMDQSNYEQVSIASDMVGDAADLRPGSDFVVCVTRSVGVPGVGGLLRSHGVTVTGRYVVPAEHD